MLKATAPFPVPGVPLVMTSHVALDVAVHVHVVAEAVTVTDPGVAASETFCPSGAIKNVQGGGAGAAACETVNVCPPIVIVPTRAAAGFGAAANDTVPSP